MPLNWHRKHLRELDARINNLSAEINRLRTEQQSAKFDVEKDFWQEKISPLENELLNVQHERASLTVNVYSSPPDPPVFEPDITPPIPDTKDGAAFFLLNACWWIVYIALKLGGYALMAWFVWTVLTA